MERQRRAGEHLGDERHIGLRLDRVGPLDGDDRLDAEKRRFAGDFVALLKEAAIDFFLLPLRPDGQRHEVLEGVDAGDGIDLLRHVEVAPRAEANVPLVGASATRKIVLSPIYREAGDLGDFEFVGAVTEHAAPTATDIDDAIPFLDASQLRNAAELVLLRLLQVFGPIPEGRAVGQVLAVEHQAEETFVEFGLQIAARRIARRGRRTRRGMGRLAVRRRFRRIAARTVIAVLAGLFAVGAAG